MFEFLNNKLYEQYYPITTESEKLDFLNSNYEKIYKQLDTIHRQALTEMDIIQYNYASKIKKERSFLGRPKVNNIVNNRVVYEKARSDKQTAKINRILPILESVAYNLECSNYENISIENLNQVLTIMNERTHKFWAVLCKLTILLAISVFILTLLF